ncbi:EAL domain-containing protein [Shewanella sp. NIFS-20-20]|uniref:EAL domain-containing protein n=1 Tax=Shewanella sp. NIFS-20-20 TaxID=2853806 RepID=UPI001C48B7FE|nr:EAL domain-containing protein [Shewanella sp. NIFS-20-20]MBV7317557.1 EAL domain-containing protein [Shewanella sp. NIFS-20-20]
MNCIFSLDCQHFTVSSVLSSAQESSSSLCTSRLYQFQTQYVIDRDGKPFGAEILSHWFNAKYKHQPVGLSLSYINDFKQMLKHLCQKINQGHELSMVGSRLFISISRLHLLDLDVVSVLVKLAQSLADKQVILTLLVNHRDTALAAYSAQAKFLLKDAGVRLCLTHARIDELDTINLHPFDCLLFTVDMLHQHPGVQLEQPLVEQLFGLRERGFGLILSDIKSAQDYQLGLQLPFSYFCADRVNDNAQ